MKSWQRRALREKKRAADVAGMAMVADVPDEGLEKEEQRKVVKLYRAMGCTVYSLSQPRATMQTAGIPDIKVYCERKRLTWWFECKRSRGGRQGDDQKAFQEIAEACRETYVIGGCEAAYEHLRRIGVIVE